MILSATVWRVIFIGFGIFTAVGGPNRRETSGARRQVYRSHRKFPARIRRLVRSVNFFDVIWQAHLRDQRIREHTCGRLSGNSSQYLNLARFGHAMPSRRQNNKKRSAQNEEISEGKFPARESFGAASTREACAPKRRLRLTRRTLQDRSFGWQPKRTCQRRVLPRQDAGDTPKAFASRQDTLQRSSRRRGDGILDGCLPADRNRSKRVNSTPPRPKQSRGSTP